MKNKNFIFFGICLLFFSCMDYIDDRDIVVYNKSSESIYSIISKNDDLSNSSFYDEFKNNQNINVNHFIFSEIKPGSKIENHDRPKDWNSFFRLSEGGKIRLFIVSKDSVVKYGWSKIFKSKIYNKKYKLSIVELNNYGWEIIYQ